MYGIQKKSAFGQNAPTTHSSKEVEFKLFARLTAQLKKAQADETGSFSDLAEAVNENLRLWTIIATDVASPENKLDKALRAQIFYLYEFTVEHSSKILKGESQSVDALIDVNQAIMRGLAQAPTKVNAA